MSAGILATASSTSTMRGLSPPPPSSKPSSQESSLDLLNFYTCIVVNCECKSITHSSQVCLLFHLYQNVFDKVVFSIERVPYLRKGRPHYHRGHPHISILRQSQRGRSHLNFQEGSRARRLITRATSLDDDISKAAASLTRIHL